MGDGILKKKERKLTRLYDAAYALFSSKGVSQTVVDDIVKKAGVAKGTFYLYFKDKHDLVNKVIVRKISRVLDSAMAALEDVKSRSSLDFEQCVIFFVDYLIGCFRDDMGFLELIFRNLSLGLYEMAFQCEEMADIRETFIATFTLDGGNRNEASKRLYLIVCLVSVVCYNSIVLKLPYEYDEIKPELYRSVRQILT